MQWIGLHLTELTLIKKKQNKIDIDQDLLTPLLDLSVTRIAKGEEPGQPPAANMMEMVWVQEMELFAH